MATSKLDSSKLLLGNKKEIAKGNSTGESNLADIAVGKIHDKAEKKTPAKETESEKEETRRVTLDIPVSLHKQIMIKIITEDVFIKDYFINLAKLDLK